MFMSTDVYLTRIMHTLEQVVVPEVESDYARGQVYAVIDLLNQLTGKIEYKSDLISQEIEMGSKMLATVIREMETVAPAPDDLKKFLDELGSDKTKMDLGLRNRLDEMQCLAIDFFNANRAKLEPEAALEVDGMIRDHITRITTRDLGMMKPPRIDKISRSKR